MSKISAVDVKRLWYADEADLASALTSTVTATILASLYRALTTSSLATGFAEILNVHQDTWTFEESEAQQDFYKNQLTGQVYRASRKTAGDVTVNFTIGQYDYTTKAAILGGTVIGDNKGWARPKRAESKYKSVIFLTDDDQLCVIPHANFNGREADADKGLGLAVTAQEMEPLDGNLLPEYWYDASVSA